MENEIYQQFDQLRQHITPDILQMLAMASLGMAFSGKIKKEVRERQGGKCHACGCIPCGCLQVHHRIPQFHGGGDGIDNAVGLCGENDNGCHQKADQEVFERGVIYPQVHRR